MPNIRYMPKWLAFLIPITLSFALLGALGCSSDDDDAVRVAGVTLSQAELQIAQGGTATLTATISPGNATDKTVAWTSSYPGVASVSDAGVVTAVSKGAATITARASDGGHSACCAVTVYTIPAAGITLDASVIALSAGEQRALTGTVLPANASDKGVIWQCSDDYVAVVSPTGMVTALGHGAATITAATRDGGFTAVCAITVQGLAAELALSKGMLWLKPGDTEQLTAAIVPENPVDTAVTWVSNNPAVATVSSDGLVTALADGQARIDVRTNGRGYLAVCHVAVGTPTITAAPGDVFAVGFKYPSENPSINMSTIWKNGQEVQRMGDNISQAFSVFVSGADVYVAEYMYYWADEGNVTSARVWKNGVPLELSNSFAQTFSVFVSGGDVYVAGTQWYHTTATFGAQLWKNGTGSRLLTSYLTTGAGLYSVVTSGNDVYATGYAGNDYLREAGVLWKNGAAQSLAGERGNYTIATGRSVAVSGDDVYVAGIARNARDINVATLWKNGQYKTLTDGDNATAAYGCCVDGGDVYAAGYDIVDGRQTATVWKNGELYQRLGGTYSSIAFSVTVSGGDVYVSGAGQVTSADPSNALVWKNGDLYQRLTTNETSRAQSVFVAK